jgi:plastocyanin
MWRLLILFPAALIAAGCGGGYGGGSSQGGGGRVLKTIQISEREYSLTPSSVTLSKSGKYAFKATNNGQVTPAFEIEGNGIEAKTGDISPGSSATLKVTLPKGGSYEMYCPVDSHKQHGMKGDVAVGTAGGSGGMSTNEGTTTSGGGYGY